MTSASRVLEAIESPPKIGAPASGFELPADAFSRGVFIFSTGIWRRSIRRTGYGSGDESGARARRPQGERQGKKRPGRGQCRHPPNADGRPDSVKYIEIYSIVCQLFRLARLSLARLPRSRLSPGPRRADARKHRLPRVYPARKQGFGVETSRRRCARLADLHQTLHRVAQRQDSAARRAIEVVENVVARRAQVLTVEKVADRKRGVPLLVDLVAQARGDNRVAALAHG